MSFPAYRIQCPSRPTNRFQWKPNYPTTNKMNVSNLRAADKGSNSLKQRCLALRNSTIQRFLFYKAQKINTCLIFGQGIDDVPFSQVFGIA